MIRTAKIIQLAASNAPLLHHGERLAFVGFLIGGVFALVSRKGLPNNVMPSFGRGQYQAVWFLKFVFLLVGVVGLGMMIAASI